MPRSRRRHHSRSRSRSRSHSHDRDREPKRRKVDSYDSPHHRRSVSSEPEDQSDKVTKAVPLDETQPSENDVSMTTADEMETPKKTLKPRHSGKLTPKQVEKKKEAEKKRQEKIEALEKKEELKKIKEQQRLKEKEEKQKEKEKMLKEKEEKKKEKEMKKKEKEEKDEMRRKEKEQEKFEKQQKMDEKIKEKQKMEEAKLKAAAAFTKFFTKRPENEGDKVEIVLVKGSINFMPFEKKADMKLAPITRNEISIDGRNDLDNLFKDQNSQCLYLNELKNGKQPRKYGKTWPKLDDSDDVVVIGETIEEEKRKIKKIRAKYFLFNENQRPAYYGTFRKTSNVIRPRKPFNKDEEKLDYEVDSDEDWEEEPDGESLKGTDDEDEEKEIEGNDANDDYEVDNEFFVPHGHLSDDEIDDEVEKRLDPEMHKAKLKLLKNEFDEERRLKTLKIRPVIIGACWEGKVKDSTAQNSISKYLAPFSLITSSEKIDVQERSIVIVGSIGKRKVKPPLSSEHLPLFLKFIHGRSVKSKELIKEFIESLEVQGIVIHVSRFAVGKQLRKYAEWKNKEDGVKKKCWIVKEEFQKKFDLDLAACNRTVDGDVSLNTS